jgi:hypothetical protein
MNFTQDSAAWAYRGDAPQVDQAENVTAKVPQENKESRNELSKPEEMTREQAPE